MVREGTTMGLNDLRQGKEETCSPAWCLVPYLLVTSVTAEFL